MGYGLSFYARQLLLTPEKFRKELVDPVLVWSAAAGAPEPDVLLTTEGGQFRQGPTARDPVVFPLRKTDKAQNAFAMGITVGRTESNDVVFVDNSVSRFHAYFQQDAKAKGGGPGGSPWKLVDAESKYGTWVGAMKLSPSKSQPIPDLAHLRFGNIEVVFYLPASFADFVKQATEDPVQGSNR